MKIKRSDLAKDVLNKILHPDPLKGEDIIIEDDSGKIIGVIIQPNTYKFLLKKVEEREDEIDSSLNEEYDKNAPSLDDLMGEK